MANEATEETLQLIRQAQLGDLDALGRIFAQCYNSVHSFVRQRLGKELRLSLDSGDIMQETFILAVEKFDAFELRHDAGIVHWLSTIAENRIRDQARRARAQKRDRRRERAIRFLRDSIDGGSIHLEPLAHIPRPGDVADSKEQEERLIAVIDELKPSYREVILHRTYADASWSQIAELMGKSSEAVVRQLHARAMVELAARMGVRDGDAGEGA